MLKSYKCCNHALFLKMICFQTLTVLSSTQKTNKFNVAKSSKVFL